MLKSTFERKNPITNSGIATNNLFFIECCSKLSASAIVSLALLNAVSPDVIGAATTPNTANAPPTFPNNELDITFTIAAAFPSNPANPFTPPKNAIAAAAHTNATTPSAIIEP